MRHKISIIWTPKDANCDRHRTATCFDHEGDLRSVGAAGLKALGFKSIDDAMSNFKGGVWDDLATWSYPMDDGEHEITVEHWAPDDPVTPERLRQWATERANEEGATPEEALVGVLGRHEWVCLEGYKEHDLRTSLHELYIYGGTFKGYNQMTMDELVPMVMEEVVDWQRENYREEAEPWGFAVMIKGDKKIWIAEGF